MKRTALIVDYADWLSSDMCHFFGAAGYAAALRRMTHQWTIIRALRLMLRVFGPREILQDRRRLIELAVIDCLISVEVLLRRPSIFVCFRSQILLAAWLARAFGAHTICVFGNVPTASDAWVGCHARPVWAFVERAQCRLARTIVCESSFVRQWLPRSKCIVVHAFRIPERSPIDERSQAPANSKCRVLFVGNEERKGVDLVAEALPALDFGKLEFYAVTASHAFKSSEHVRVVPPMAHDKFLSFLDGMDAVLIPTRSDGGPRLLFEALAKGKLVICSRNCAGADLAENPLVTLIELTPACIAGKLDNLKLTDQNASAGIDHLETAIRDQHRRFLARIKRLDSRWALRTPKAAPWARRARAGHQ